MNKLFVIGLVVATLASGVYADDAKPAKKEQSTQPAPDRNARPGGNASIPRQRFNGALPMMRRYPADLPLRNVQDQSLRLRQQPVFTPNARFANDARFRGRVQPDGTVDQNVTTNWRGRRSNDQPDKVSTNTGAVARSDGSRRNGSLNTVGRHRGGNSVVPFNNDNLVDFNDATRRCHDHRNWNCDRNWWRRHCTTVILIGGGFYGWNAGWWYPAWGYNSYYSYYPYDGPIYGYDGLPPDQVIASVQGALQEMGYFPYAVDGVLGPATRAAIADYQRDHGLFVNAAIDRPTLVSLGFIG